MNEINPPGLHRHCETLSELKAHGKSLNQAIQKDERFNLQRTLELGRVLMRLKEMADRGEWEGALKDMEVTSQRASEAVRLAKSPAPGISTAGSVREALRVLTEAENPPLPPPNSTMPTGGHPAPAVSEKKECRWCRTHSPAEKKKNCKDCAALNKPQVEQPPAPPVPEPPADPPEDASEEVGGWKFCRNCREKEYLPGCPLCQMFNGREMTVEEQREHAPEANVPKPPPSLVKQLEKVYGQIWRMYRLIGRTFGLPVGKSVTDPENDPAIKQMILAYADLKERTKRFIWAHERKKV